MFAGGWMSLLFYGSSFDHVKKECSCAWDGVWLLKIAGQLHALTQIISWQQRRP